MMEQRKLIVFLVRFADISTIYCRTWVESCHLLSLVEVGRCGKVIKMLLLARNVESRLQCNEDDTTVENAGEYSVINALPSDR